MTSNATFFTVGPNSDTLERGCGHKHRSAVTAAKCLRRIQRDFEMAGGYSPDSVVAFVDGEQAELEDALCESERDDYLLALAGY